ncbi:MAG: hypothetical protein ACP5L5_11490, partial [Vulcanisaeta sp.]|uniref:hypothetical protein n=1 Tax=Vulcanisaeta sp. TaxID=2020871 RepID=UPI003D1444BF
MRVSNAIPIVLAVLILLCMPIMADVIFRYNGIINVKPARSPITVISGSCPCGCSTWNPTYAGFASTITAYTMSTTGGYVLTTPLVTLNASNAGTITMTLSTNTIVVSDYINGTRIYPGQGSISLNAGQNLLIQKLTLASPVTSTITLNGQYNYQPTTGITFYYSFTETINPPTANVMNLLNGQQSWYVSHIYQGDLRGNPSSLWPVYYGPITSSSNYWYYISTGINQPVLNMVSSAYSWSSGAMFWQESYSGGSVTITVVGVYSNNGTPPYSPAYPYVGDGYIIYLFLKPQWSISARYNYSIPYVASPYTGIITGIILSPVQGDVMMPQSSSEYIIVEWNPLWQYAYATGGAPGQWDVWLVVNRNGQKPVVNPYPSPNLGSPYYGWDGIGTGA